MQGFHSRFAFVSLFAMALMPLCLHAQTFAELPGVRLRYVDTGGKGVPIVLLHAATGSADVWENQIKPFRDAGYRVIAFDRRGWGQSVTTAGAEPGTAAGDLQGLMDFLKIDRFHLVGTAAGGFVAFDYALSFPQRLRSLIVAASIGGVVDEDFQALGRRMRPPQFAALPPDLRELGPAYRAANAKGTERWLENERASRPPGPVATAQPLRNQMTLALLETVKTPTLFIAGGADMYAPPPLMQMFAQRIKGSQLVTVPDAGHSIYWEMPQAFNDAVLRFVRKH